MSDPLTWSIRIGHWAGTQIRVHAFLLIFAVGKLLGAAWEKERPGLALAATASWLLLLLVALAIKLFVQGVMAARVGLERDEIRVWPLGDLGHAGLSAAERTFEAAIVAASGLLTSGALAISTYVGLKMTGASMVFNPFGHPTTGGAPILSDGTAAKTLSTLWWFGQFGYLNSVLFIANLIPALPFDTGRIFRPILAARSRDSLIAPYTARTFAFLLAAIGLVLWLYMARPGSGELFSLAILIEWMLRIEARSSEEGGFFEDGVFGYDFSQGYTSLEAGAATVRPPREGALRRWRRRRADQRLRRQHEEDAAETSRMDDILDKIHRNGRSALSEDEERFLVHVSAKYKKRARGR